MQANVREIPFWWHRAGRKRSRRSASDGMGESGPVREDTDMSAAAFEDDFVGPREVVVRYRDAIASDVRIAGDFNGWVPDKGVRSLIESEWESRIWTKILQLPPGKYQYRYVVDGDWCEDPDNPDFVQNDLGGQNSVLIVR